MTKRVACAAGLEACRLAILIMSGCGQPAPVTLPAQSASATATATETAAAVTVAPMISTGTEGRVAESPNVAEVG